MRPMPANWPGDERSFENFLKGRNKALRELDLTYARHMIPRASSDDVLLLALHKARYDCVDLEPEYRHESGRWLREHGYGRMNGLALLPEGELPE